MCGTKYTPYAVRKKLKFLDRHLSTSTNLQVYCSGVATCKFCLLMQYIVLLTFVLDNWVVTPRYKQKNMLQKMLKPDKIYYTTQVVPLMTV